MTKTIRLLGAALRYRFLNSLKKPMGWSMVDAVAKLEEAEDEQQFSIDSKSTTGGAKDKAVAPRN